MILILLLDFRNSWLLDDSIVLRVDTSFLLVLHDVMHDFFFEICFAKRAFGLDIQPVKPTLFMEVVLWVTAEDHDVFIIFEVFLANGAFHSLVDLIVVAVFDLEQLEEVASESDLFRPLANLPDLVFNLLHAIDNLLTLTLRTHQLSHSSHSQWFEVCLDPLLQVLPSSQIISHGHLIKLSVIFFV